MRSLAGTQQDTIFESPALGLTSNYVRIRLKNETASAGERKTVKLLSSFSQKRNEKFPVVDAELY